MANSNLTYFVALPFKRSDPEDGDGTGGDIVAGEAKEARTAEHAVRLADKLAKAAGHCGAIAFSRTGDPALGDYEDAVILKSIGEVNVELLTV